MQGYNLILTVLSVKLIKTFTEISLNIWADAFMVEYMSLVRHYLMLMGSGKM
jgi:hypothetical protein